MTYVTGQPIIFVGCGQVGHHLVEILIAATLINRQTYTDLRQLRVANVVSAILSD
jgi:signal recognition particle receptor subunit alpha